MQHHTDVVIIGAGPVGLFTIFECGMLRLQCHVIDALDMVGGQCSALYPEKPIYDIPAHPQIAAGDLIENLKIQAAPFNPTYHLSQQVTTIEPLDEAGKSWRIVTSKNTEILCKSIIIAAGVGAFGPNRPPLEGLEIYEQTGCVQYYVRSREEFRNKNVVIAGGGDSAVDWAISLEELAKSVTVIHRRPKFRAAPESEARLHHLVSESRINLVVPYQLEGLAGHNGQLQTVIVKSLDGSVQQIKADILLPFYGLSMNLGPIAEWGLGLENKCIAVHQATSATNRPGIYAVGDVATYPHKLKLILTGFAEAAHSAHAIHQFIYPDEVVHFEYSTTKGLPNQPAQAA
ncbi:MAG TPA: NAD(P)/FAD-dependent oxidoreductase [Candidatus Nitrosotenuis sp.]|jgi:thioredoxin reductase (NADPH)|nr:NAD(P)/FAD-dependent oxidoreductase [Candidatus Nitrosotenuis sp.]